MNEELMLELRQLAQAMRAIPNPIDASYSSVEEPSTFGSRLRSAWEATVRPLRAQL